MNRRRKLTISYFAVPVLFVSVWILIVIIAGKPYINSAEEIVYSVMKDSIPEIEIDNGQLSDDGNNTSEETVPLSDSKYARLICDSIELSCDLYYGDTNVLFKEGAGQYENGAFPWNSKTMLVGGHDITYFSGFGSLKVDDIFRIKTEKQQYQYRVVKIAAEKPELLTDKELNRSEYELILYTCYPIGEVNTVREKRLFIYCELITQQITEGK